MLSREIVTGTYEFRCSNCGAPLDVSPETIVAVCSYCGYPNWVREDLREELYIVEPLSEKEILEKVWERMRRDRDLRRIASQITIHKPLQIYIPYYFADAVSEADYEGRVRVYLRRCTGSGKNTTCQTYPTTVYVKGHYGPFREEIPIIGRRGVRAFSIKILGRYYLETRPERKPLSSIKLDRSETRRILTVEIDKETAKTIALDDHLDELRRRVVEEMKKKAEKIARRSTRENVVKSVVIWKRIKPMNVNLRISPITLLPLYVIPYTYSNGTYRLFLTGWDGETIVAEEPMNMFTRLIWGATGTIGSGVFGGLAALSISLLGRYGVFGVIFAIIGGALSYYSIRMATRPVRVEVVGEKFKTMKLVGKRVWSILSKINEAIDEFTIRSSGLGGNI